jgi:hypothetical protein
MKAPQPWQLVIEPTPAVHARVEEQFFETSVRVS